MSDCKHGIDVGDCFDCRTPHRIRYAYRGDTRYRTRSAEVSRLTDGLNHEAQWTPPPGSALEQDYAREHVVYFNRQHQDWMNGTVATPHQVADADDVPTWAQGQDGYELEDEWTWHPTDRPWNRKFHVTESKPRWKDDPPRRRVVEVWGADNRVENVPVVPDGIDKRSPLRVGYSEERVPAGSMAQRRKRYARATALLEAVATVRRVTGREWVDSDDVELALATGAGVTTVDPIKGYLNSDWQAARFRLTD